MNIKTIGVYLLTLSLLSGCSLSVSNKSQVGQYNDTVLSRIETYEKVAETNYKNKEEWYKQLVTNEVEFIKEYDIEIRDLEGKYVDEFKTYSVLKHEYFTGLENEHVREVIVLNGIVSKMYVNMIWDTDGKLIYIDRKVISNE